MNDTFLASTLGALSSHPLPGPDLWPPRCLFTHTGSSVYVAVNARPLTAALESTALSLEGYAGTWDMSNPATLLKSLATKAPGGDCFLQQGVGVALPETLQKAPRHFSLCFYRND